LRKPRDSGRKNRNNNTGKEKEELVRNFKKNIKCLGKGKAADTTRCSMYKRIKLCIGNRKKGGKGTKISAGKKDQGGRGTD